MMNQNLNRRRFIKSTAAIVGAVSMSNPWLRAQGANDNIRVAVIGFNGRGKSHIDGFKNLPGVRLVALCDVDGDVLDEGIANHSPAGTKLKAYKDYRRLLEDDEIDLVSIATPNHTHALISIAAIQSGKDVYIEKPVSHNVWEGRQIVNAARKYDKIVQVGTQSRSNPGMIEAVNFIQNGGLGKIKVVRGLCYKRRKSIGKVSGAQQPPPNLDYDLWVGPAPMKPLMRGSLHYDWHWVRDTGNGDLGNQGIHQMDIARWILNEDRLSPEVLSIGGRFGYDDDGDTANTQIIYHNYKEAPLVFEVRGLGKWANQDARPKYRGVDIGVVVDCEHGYMVIPNYYSATVYDHSGRELQKFDGRANHFENCIKAVRSRKKEDLNADILEGHLSSALCHTGNTSYYLGQNSSSGEIMEQLEDEGSGSGAFGRMLEHLEVNEIDLRKTPITLGKSLRMNTRTERFKRDDEANAMLTRDYRAPFIVPEIR